MIPDDLKKKQERREKLSNANRDVVLGRSELTVFGNPYHAVTYLNRAKKNIESVLNELADEGVR